MAAASIATMASGGASPLFKFYFFCQAADGNARALIETIVNKTTSLASMTFKCESASLAEQVGPYCKQVLQQFSL